MPDTWSSGGHLQGKALNVDKEMPLECGCEPELKQPSSSRRQLTERGEGAGRKRPRSRGGEESHDPALKQPLSRCITREE